MHRRKLALASLGLIVLGLELAVAAPLPRPSPELKINTPDGKTAMLSSFKGKVVVIEFLFVKSQHCLRVAKLLNDLQAELGPRGFQPIGIAFDAPNAAITGGDLLGLVIDALKLNFPVGYSMRADVDSYLARGGNEMLSIPQVVVIDRTGTIRAATGDGPNPNLEDPNYLRKMLDALLRESTSEGGKAKL